ncbi:MAG: SRPBCC domain-containing protein [Deltaproteobacteria bacterium]|nr:SRPBCC domain-containing protein [Deltaproteobacteria bacterium]
MKHETEIMIDAPAAALWSHLIDFARYDEWSTTFALRGRPAAGERCRVRFHLFGIPLTYPVSLVTVDDSRELRWLGGPRGIIQGSHYFTLEPYGPKGDRTRFVHGEEFAGFAVPALWPLLVRAIGSAYDGFNRELKQRVESARALR